MPDPNTHTAAGLGAAWAAGKIIGLEADYLIVGLVGALLASARETPREAVECAGALVLDKIRPLVRVVLGLCAVSFFAATSTALLVLFYPSLGPGGIPIAGLAGFFGTALIKSVTELISRSWAAVLTKIGADPDKGGPSHG